MKGYGINRKTESGSVLDEHLEELDILGFTIFPDVLDEEELAVIRTKVDAIYSEQENRAGRDVLKKIKESNLARCLLAYDDYFVGLLKKELIVTVLQRVIGENYVLTLQNAIINRPGDDHHQSSWHRDLPYQDYVISQPIALNVFFCIDPFTEETGSTIVLPFSHRREIMPSDRYVEKHMVSSNARAGSVIVFNSWLYHRAGTNRSNQIRRGINHLYAVPIIRQQIDLPRFLGDKFAEDESLRKVLGYTWQTPVSVDDYREGRLARLDP